MLVFFSNRKHSHKMSGGGRGRSDTYQSCNTPMKPLSRISGRWLEVVLGTTFMTHTVFPASSKAELNPPYRAFISSTFLSILKGGVGSSSPGLFGWSENISGESRDQ